MSATPIVIGTSRVLICPDRIAQADFAGIGYCARSGTGDTTYHCARTRVARERADRCAGAGPKQAARDCAIARSGTASGERKHRERGKKNEAFHLGISLIDRALPALQLSEGQSPEERVSGLGYTYGSRIDVGRVGMYLSVSRNDRWCGRCFLFAHPVYALRY